MNKNKRYVTSVTQHSDQFLAILLGLKSILGMPISIAKPIARSKPGVTVELNTLKLTQNYLLMKLKIS